MDRDIPDTRLGKWWNFCFLDFFECLGGYFWYLAKIYLFHHYKAIVLLVNTILIYQLPLL